MSVKKDDDHHEHLDQPRSKAPRVDEGDEESIWEGEKTPSKDSLYWEIKIEGGSRAD